MPGKADHIVLGGLVAHVHDEVGELTLGKSSLGVHEGLRVGKVACIDIFLHVSDPGAVCAILIRPFDIIKD
jgi:hypothetical protein